MLLALELLEVVAPLSNKSFFDFVCCVILDALIVVLNYLIFTFKLSDQLIEIGHFELKVLSVVGVFIGKIIIMIRLVLHLRHGNMPFITLVGQLHVVQLVDEDGAGVCWHGLEHTDAEVPGKIVGGHIDLIDKRSRESLGDCGN